MNIFLKYIAAKPHRLYIYIFVIFFLCLSFSNLIFAQQTEQKENQVITGPMDQLPTLEELDTKIKQLKDAQEKQQDPEQIKQLNVLIGIYEQARVQLNNTNKNQTLIDEFRNLRISAPERLITIKEQIQGIPSEVKTQEPYEDWSLTQVEQQYTQMQVALEKAKKDMSERENDAKRRTERRTEISKETAQANEQLQEIKRQLNAKPEEQAAPELLQARRTLLLLTEKAWQKKFESNTEEILSYDVRGDLLAARRDLAARQVAYYEALVKQWQGILDQKRKQEADRAAEQARQARRIAAQAHPAIRELADENAQLAELRTGPKGLVARIAQQAQYLKQIQNQAKNLEDDFNSIKNKIDAAGLTNVVGVILLNKRNELPDIRIHKRAFKERQSETASARYEWLKYGEQLAKLDMEKTAKELLLKIEEPIDSFQRQDIEDEIRKLLNNKRQFLEALIGDYDDYLVNLAELDFNERKLVAVAADYYDYIDENILWIKSSTPVSLTTLNQSKEALFWLLNPQNWRLLIRQYGRDIKTKPSLYMLFVLIFGFLLTYRRRLRKQISDISTLVQGRYSDKISHTIKTFLLSLLLAAPVPLLLFFLGWHLALTFQESEFVIAAAAGLRVTGVVYVVLELLRIIFLPKGLADAHFGMPKPSCKYFRKSLIWFMMCVLPLVFVVEVFAQQSEIAFIESLSRLVLIAALIILSVFLALVIRPSGPFMNNIILARRGGWLDRLRIFWYFLSVGSPLALALLAVMGYQYAARHLTGCLEASMFLILAVLLITAMLGRILHVIQARLIYRKSILSLAARQEQGKPNSTSNDNLIAAEASSSPEEELQRLDLQAKRLINTFAVFISIIGFWYIWSDVFPALGILKRIALWETTISDQIISITLANLILALLIILITFVAARNILGLLEMAVLERLPLDQGARFAIITLTRYVIVVVGIVMAFGQIGIGWSKVQWLVAALSVGLGFGLQEIFANFVSGLLILFDQPIRVGDIVTVDNVTGKVTKISIRATTVRDWDRKEYLVPNKDFITGRLLNWTLSDKVNRIVIKVGIAYGSNVELALKTLLRVAKENSLILDDPEPLVTFEGFGESSLDLTLRCFLPNLDDRLTTISELHTAIDREFRRAGIEIAFPQRDIHVRSVKFPIPIDTKLEDVKEIS